MVRKSGEGRPSIVPGYWPLTTDPWPLSLSPRLLLDLDIQAADFLIQRGERDFEVLGGLGLVPVAFFQHVGDDAPLHVFHDFKRRRIGGWGQREGGHTPTDQLGGGDSAAPH